MVADYQGAFMGDEWNASHGVHAVESTLPASRLLWLDGKLVELPEPEPANRYAQWYAGNPDLAPRVREYAAMLAELGLPDTAKTEEIAAAVDALDDGAPEKIARLLRIQTAFSNIVLNLEYLDVSRPQYTAWAEMKGLIANLPKEEA